MSMLRISIQYCTRGSSRAIRQETKGIEIRKEEV